MAPPQLPIARTVADLRRQVADWRAQGLRVGLVPTMGALHEGHLSLVRLALTRADRVIVTIFVNPTQFGPQEDLDKDPRREAQDCTLAQGAGAHLVFAPGVAEMYPEGFFTSVKVSGVSQGLCGDFRPGHFEGVATIVAKLLLQALPDIAVFGEKDYQQLCVIRRLARDLDIPVEIAGAPTVRDDQGLALSSRNAYLSPEDLQTARQLNKIMVSLIGRIRARPGDLPIIIEEGKKILLAAGFSKIDYLDVRDAENLEPAQVPQRPARLLAAVYLGRTRLIDNMPLA